MRRLVLLAFVLVLGCDGDAPPPDAAARDAAGGGADGGPTLCSRDEECPGGGFCGDGFCSLGVCARGGRVPPCARDEICDEENDRCLPRPTGGDGLPLGIPTPSFGWELDASADPTLWVDGTDGACDDAGPGTADQPLCDLFRGGASVTLEAGTVVRILGGPYLVSGDRTITLNGTAESPILVVGEGAARPRFDAQGVRTTFTWEGSYGLVEHLDFYAGTRHRVAGDHLALRDVAVHNPEGAFIDFNPVVSVTGHDVLIRRSAIFHNRREVDVDSHGIQASEGSYNVWILDNELYDNHGDSFQACHECFDAPPHHVYLGRNLMHEDRENGIDLKTVHDVVISENVLYGYGSSATSGGDAMVIGSNGFDDAINQGPRRIWVLHNELRDSSTGIRIEGSEDVWLVGNVFSNLGTGLQIDDKPHRLVVVAANTMTGIAGDAVSVFGCQPDALTLLDNLLAEPGERHLDMGGCPASVLRIEHTLFGGVARVRVDGAPHASAASLDGTAFAFGSVEGDPGLDAALVPTAGSLAHDAGGSLAEVYDAFDAAHGLDVAVDRAGTARPAGSAEDIGAYERP